MHLQQEQVWKKLLWSLTRNSESSWYIDENQICNIWVRGQLKSHFERKSLTFVTYSLSKGFKCGKGYYNHKPCNLLFWSIYLHWFVVPHHCNFQVLLPRLDNFQQSSDCQLDGCLLCCQFFTFVVLLKELPHSFCTSTSCICLKW